MSSFGSQLNNILSGFTDGVLDGLLGIESVKDYKHASKTFLSDGYALAPQSKYLFHVYFNLNTAQIPGLKQAMGSGTDLTSLGMMVKTADLPSFRVETEEFNQYNRKRLVNSKIRYNPINITFHDDGSDLIRSMWYNFYTYYFSDARHYYAGAGTTSNSSTRTFDFNRRDIYDAIRNVSDWGYNADSFSGSYKPNFFRDIKIYGLNRGNFVQYTLINPTITDWAHDQFDYSQVGGMMSNRMTLQYETVKYSRGKIGAPGGEVEGWGDSAFYDSSPSKLSKPGTQSIFGAGGALDAVESILTDLSEGDILSALLTGATAYENFSDADWSTILANEGVDVLTGVASNVLLSNPVQNSVSNFLFTKPTTNEASLPYSSTTVYSNQGYSSATGWNNPNLTAPTSRFSPTTASDISSNGIVINRNI